MLGARFKNYRLTAKMTQREVAEAAGVNVLTVSRFESEAAKNISLGTFLSLMKAVGCIDCLDALLADEPESLYLYNDSRNKIQRIRHKSPAK